MVPCLALFLAQAAQQHVQRGYALVQSGDLKSAEAEARQAIQASPGDAVAMALLGMVLFQENKLSEAAVYFQRALKTDPSDTGTRYNLAVTEYRLGKVALAKANLEQILKQKPDHQQAVALLEHLRAAGGLETALAQYRAGRFADSERTLEQLVQAGSRDPKVYNLLGWCLHRRQRTNEALAAMRRAIELAPGDAQWYANSAQILLESGMFQAAYGTAAKALELSPASVQALKVKGHVEMNRGAFKLALESFQRAVAADKNDPEAVRWLGGAQQKLYSYSDAAATFERGIARFPRYAPLYEAYAELLLDPGQDSGKNGRPRAASLLEKALQLDPRSPEAHAQLGKLLLESGDAPGAIPHLETAAKSSSATSATHLALANAYRAAGRKEDQARELAVYKEKAQAEQKK